MGKRIYALVAPHHFKHICYVYHLLGTINNGRKCDTLRFSYLWYSEILEIRVTKTTGT